MAALSTDIRQNDDATFRSSLQSNVSDSNGQHALVRPGKGVINYGAITAYHHMTYLPTGKPVS